MAGSCLHPLQPALCALSGQREQQEGPREKREQEIIRTNRKKRNHNKKKAITPGTAAGVQRNVHLLPADTGSVRSRKCLHGEQHSEHRTEQHTAPPCPRSPGPRSVPPLPIHSSSRQPRAVQRAGGKSRKHSGVGRKGGKREKRGEERPVGAPTPRRDVPASSPSAGLPRAPERRVPLRPNTAKSTTTLKKKNGERERERKFLPGEQLPWHIFIFT